jgi:iron complex outermembrane receptor protein
MTHHTGFADASGHVRGTLYQSLLGAGSSALMLLVAGAVDAQTPPPTSGTATVGEIVVTGSLIRRTDTETPSPVQVVTAADLQESGYTTVSEVLRNLSANGAGTLSQSFNQAFAGGGSGVALRGLTVGGTLTLIDGHRMVGYPLTDDGERNFVDVTAIPFNAVERIEVLKDGASSEYGSDAIAGVVNIILKKNYSGAEVTVEGGTSSHSDAKMAHVTGIWGAGDLNSDGYNVYVSAEYRHQGEVLLSSRSGNLSKLDFRDVGGVNTRPGAGSNPFVPFPASLTGYLINPATNALDNTTIFLGGKCSLAQLQADQCTYTNPGLQLAPPTSSANVLAKFTKNLSGDWQLNVSASLFHTTAQQASTSYPGGGGYNFAPAGFYPGGFFTISLPPGGAPVVHPNPPLVVTVPANYPGNTFGAPAPLVYNFPELGFPYETFSTNTYRLVAELNGTAAGWNIGASAGMMYAKLTQDAYGAIEPVALQNALNNGYALGSASGTSTFAPKAEATDSSNLNFISVHGTRGLAQLPGGNLSVAIGAELNQKLLDATAYPTQVAGTMEGTNNAYAIGSQMNTAAFIEFSAPVLTNLELDAAGRYDHYNTAAGSAATPKFGIKYAPIPELALRGTWGKGFRAPSIPESASSGLAFGAGTVADPTLCPAGAGSTAAGTFPSQCQISITGVQPSNPALKPETTTSWTAGFIVEPTRAFSVGADYYDIKINRDIISAFEAGGLGITGLTSLVRGPSVTLPAYDANGNLVPTQTPVGLIIYKAYPYINGSQSETSGVDLDLKARVGLGAAGRLTAELNYTHMIKYTLGANGVTYELAGTHGPSGVSGDTGNPKDRGVFSLTWDRGPLSITGTVNYVGSFNVTDPSAGQPDCTTAILSNATSEGGPKFAGPPTPGSYCTIGSFTDVDFYARYQVSNGLEIHASVVNAFAAQPPFDAVTYGGGGGAAYDAAMHQIGAVGRFFTLGVNYKF